MPEKVYACGVLVPKQRDSALRRHSVPSQQALLTDCTGDRAGGGRAIINVGIPPTPQPGPTLSGWLERVGVLRRIFPMPAVVTGLIFLNQDFFFFLNIKSEPTRKKKNGLTFENSIEDLGLTLAGAIRLLKIKLYPPP